MTAPEDLWRLAAAGVLGANLAVSAYYRRRARSREPIARSAEDPRLIAARLLLAGPAAALLIAYLAVPDSLRWARLDLPGWVRAAAAIVGFALVPLNVWILRSIGSNISETVLTKPHHELVRRGPYARVRHPLYGAGLVLCLSLSLIAANWVLLGLTAVGGVWIRGVVVPREERELEKRFGVRYREYRRVTGALLPRFRTTSGVIPDDHLP